jgi:hypothetical protein
VHLNETILVNASIKYDGDKEVIPIEIYLNGDLYEVKYYYKNSTTENIVFSMTELKEGLNEIVILDKKIIVEVIEEVIIDDDIDNDVNDDLYYADYKILVILIIVVIVLFILVRQTRARSVVNTRMS